MAEQLSGIDVFVAAVETGSFSSAAERMHLTRSAVAKAVARIETRLGVRLFHRTTRSQSLTQDGQVYYERCVRALDELRAGHAMLESGRHDATGRLRVTMPVLFGRRCVAPVLTRLAAQHPRLELDLAFSDRNVDLAEDGFDIAVRSGTVGDGAGLMTRTIALQRMTVCASPAYLETHGRPRTLEDLLDHRAITYGRNGRARAWQFPLDGEMREVMPASRLRLDDLDAIGEAAEAGHGLAWLPCWLVRDRVRAGALVPLLPDIPRLIFPLRALWLQTPHLPMRIRLAIDALAGDLPGSAEL